MLSVCQGGLGNDLDFKDMSGKSFQRGQFFKVMMRGTNWEGADLTDARRALSAAQPPLAFPAPVPPTRVPTVRRHAHWRCQRARGEGSGRLTFSQAFSPSNCSVRHG